MLGQAPGGRISAPAWGAAAGLRKVLFECGRPRQNEPGARAVVWGCGGGWYGAQVSAVGGLAVVGWGGS